MQCNIRFSRNIKISPLISFVCRDTQLIFSKACAVAAFIFQAEHGIKVSDMIFKRREIIIPAYTLYELAIKIMVHGDQIAAAAELYELPISIFHSRTVSLQRIICESKYLGDTIR